MMLLSPIAIKGSAATMIDVNFDDLNYMNSVSPPSVMMQEEFNSLIDNLDDLGRKSGTPT